jgi:predicted DNA-binding antitoxin AbrB/MazE fold protein
MDQLQIEAIYVNGTLKLSHKLPLKEGQKVAITIHPSGSASDRMFGSLPWNGDPEELHKFLDDPDEGAWGRHDV